MKSLMEIYDEMGDVSVSSEKERAELAEMYRKKLYKAYVAEHPEMDNQSIEDEIDQEIEGWEEVTWTDSDWADFYGCDKEDLDDIDSFDGFFNDD